jgi:hypothetical protein
MKTCPIGDLRTQKLTQFQISAFLKALKDQSHEIFDPRFYLQSMPLRSLINGLNNYCILLRICKYKWLRAMMYSAESRFRTMMHSAESIFVFEYLCEYESIFETALAHESVDSGVLLFGRTYKTSPHKTSPRQNVSIHNVSVTERLHNKTSLVTKRLRHKTSP